MILSFEATHPEIAADVFVAPSADIIGDVRIGALSSVWFQVVIRGDVNFIRIGERTNIQDQSCLHVTRGTGPLVIGNEVTVGHQCLLHACEIQDRVLIGMGSVILDGASIPSDSFVGAGSLVTQGKNFPSGHLIMGRPAKLVRALTEEELAFLRKSAENYVGDAKKYRSASPS